MKKFLLIILLFGTAAYANDSSRDLLVKTAESNNRELKAMKLDIDAKDTMSLTAYLIPRTMFSYESMNNNISRKDSMGDPVMKEKKYSVTQEIPFPTTFAYGSKVKKMDIKIAELQYIKTFSEMKREITVMYNELVYMNNQIKIMEDKHGELTALVRFTEAKVKTGKASIDELIKGKVMASMIEKELITMRSDKLVTENNLLKMLNVQKIPDDIEYSYTSDYMAESETSGQLGVGSPDIKILNAETEKLDRQESYAMAMTVPDLNLGFTLSLPDNGDVNYNYMIGVSVPLFFAFNELAESRAAGKMKAANKEIIASRLYEIDREINSLQLKIKKNKETIALINDKLILDTRQALDLSLKNFRIDKAEVMSILNTLTLFYDYSIEIEKAKFEIASDSARINYYLGR